MTHYPSLKQTDLARGWGHHWLSGNAERTWETFAAQAVDISGPDFGAGAHSASSPWWRRRHRDWLKSLRWRHRRRRAASLPLPATG